MDQNWVIRRAEWKDVDAIARQNAAMALETEDKVLDQAILASGVRGALEHPAHVRYWVAEATHTTETGQNLTNLNPKSPTETTDRIIGQAMTTPEWSDWRNGWVWWFQSVFVAQSWRGKGVFASLVDAICRDAKEFSIREGTPVVALRLYVELENQNAQEVYRRLGFEDGCYQVMEMSAEKMAGRGGKPYRLFPESL